MKGSSLRDSFLNNPLFAESAAGATLRAKPLGYIDVGARGGVDPMVEPLAGATSVLAFEVDAEECARVRSEYSDKTPWAEFRIEPFAISGRDGPAELHITARPVNSSLLRPSAAFASRYDIAGFRVVRSIPLETRCLDTILFKVLSSAEHWGEFLKLDVQGAELDVLSGAPRMLAERTVAAVVEVEFCRLYEEQPLFSEVEVFLRGKGFTFFGFRSMSYRAGQLRDVLGQRGKSWNERLFHADALFFRDPLSGATLSSRANHVLFVCAMLLGYYDFALEIALGTWAKGEEAERLTRLVRECALGRIEF